MASKTGFKQQCPNCEAIVPIKDDKLIGKRIRCPKCGEPFLVEDLDGVAATTKTAKPGKDTPGASAAAKTKPGAKRTTRDEDDEEPKFKKKKGDSNKLIIGLGLAGVAVLLLAVAVFFMTKGGSNTTKTTSTPGSGPRPTPAQAETKPAENAPAVPAISLASLSNISNMLPNETQIVVNLPMPVIGENALGQEMFVDNLGMSTQDAGRMGFALVDVERWIIALSYSDPVWYWHVIRTTKPIDFNVLKKTLDLKPAAGSPAQGMDYFVTQVNWAESAKMVPSFLKPSGESEAGGLNHPMFVRLHDPHTLILADQFPMKKFLEAKGHFKEEVPLPADAADSQGGFFPGGGGRGGGGGGGRPRVGAPPGGPPTPPAETPGGLGLPGAPPDAKAPAAGGSGNYRTINPHLKRMLERVESNSPYLVSMAVDLEDEPYVHFLANLFLGYKGKLHSAGFSFQWKEEKMVAMTALECDSDQEASSLRQGLDKQLQPIPYDRLLAISPTYTLRFKKGREKPPDATTPGGPGGRSPGAPPGGRSPGGPPRRSPGGPPGAPPGEGPNPRNPNQPNENETPAAVTIYVDVNTQGRWVSLINDIKAREEVQKDVLQWVEPYLVRLQGEFEMAMARPNPYRLAGSILGYADQAKEYPRGTTEYRKPSPARAGRAWPPDERVSWMAELLPYLGYEHVSRRIRRERSWRDEENLTPASVLVPNFLDPGSLKSTWYVTYPGLGPEVAATHFVGMAGVGLDAANYPPDHPDAGMFSYEHKTPLNRVTDKSKTIMMIQVPPTSHNPWIAGGGSTIRGVPEKNSIQPFLTLNAERQRGTTVLMADGSVRWMSEKISDDVLKALARVKGDKSEVKLSELKPLPKPEEQSKAADSTASAAKPEEKKPAAPATPEAKPPAPPAEAKPGAPPEAK